MSKLVYAFVLPRWFLTGVLIMFIARGSLVALAIFCFLVAVSIEIIGYRMETRYDY